MRQVAILLAAALTVIAVQGATNGTVRVGRYFEPGFCDRMKDGSIVGANEDVIGRVAEYAGWRVEWVEGDYNRLLASLRSGEIDVLAGVSMSEERRMDCLFPRLSTGMFRTYLFAHRDSRYEVSGFGEWEGAVIGSGPGEVANAVLREYIRANRIGCQVREYASSNDALLAYFRGECQLLHSVGLRSLSYEKLVHTFPPVPEYIVVSREKPEILSQIESAMDRINVDTPGFLDEVNRRHYLIRRTGSFYLTESERIYLRRRVTTGSPIMVEISPTVDPLKSWDARTGEPYGFIRPLIDELSRRVGVPFCFLPPADAETVRNRYEQGEFDLWATYNADLSGLRFGYEAVGSVTLPRVVVCRSEIGSKELQSLRAAVPKTDFELYRAGHLVPIVGAKIYDTLEDCVNAIREGKADYTSCPASRAVNLICELDDDKVLEIRPVSERLRRIPFPFTFSPRCDPRLVSIITKAIQSIDLDDTESFMSGILAAYVRDEFPTSPTFISIFLLVVGVLLVTGGVLVANRARRISEDLVIRERENVNRDQLMRSDVRKLITSAEIIASRAEFIRNPGVTREQALGWTAEILRHSENMLKHFEMFRQEIIGHNRVTTKLRKIRGGGGRDQ